MHYGKKDCIARWPVCGKFSNGEDCLIRPLGEQGVEVGREANQMGMVYPMKSVSRKHLEMWVEDGSVIIVDLGSKNGVTCEVLKPMTREELLATGVDVASLNNTEEDFLLQLKRINDSN